MEYLEYKLTFEEIDGIQIKGDLTICHRLFANDVGIFILAKESSFTKSKKCGEFMSWPLELS